MEQARVELIEDLSVMSRLFAFAVPLLAAIPGAIALPPARGPGDPLIDAGDTAWMLTSTASCC